MAEQRTELRSHPYLLSSTLSSTFVHEIKVYRRYQRERVGSLFEHAKIYKKDDRLLVPPSFSTLLSILLPPLLHRAAGWLFVSTKSSQWLIISSPPPSCSQVEPTTDRPNSHPYGIRLSHSPYSVYRTVGWARRCGVTFLNGYRRSGEGGGIKSGPSRNLGRAPSS